MSTKTRKTTRHLKSRRTASCAPMASSIQDKTIEPLIRAPEAAKILNIGISSVYRLAEAGLIPSISLGGSRRFRKSSLLAWMDEKERKSLSLAITGGIKK